MRMFYKQPAKDWKGCIPIGNGRLGGMVFGGIFEDKIYLNEESIWSGCTKKKETDEKKKFESKYLERVRKAVLEEEYIQAEEILEKHLLGEFTESYLPLGVLHINIPIADEEKEEGEQLYQGYERELDLSKGIVKADAKTSVGAVHKEYFCSYPDQCIVIRIEAENILPKVNISLESELKKSVIAEQEKKEVKYNLQCPEHVDPNYVESKMPVIWGENGKKFSAYVSVLETDGIVDNENEITIQKARTITIAVTAVKNSRILEKYEVLREKHIEDYQKLYNRVELYLGEQPEIPTDERLQLLRMGKKDNALYALYFQYGRYLLMSSSRGKDGLPATLQGIWSWEMQPPWSSNWTTNINVQMNYWPVWKCNLPECIEPYLGWMKQLANAGRETADKYFGCRGYSINHNVDGGYASNPVGIPYGGEKSHDGAGEYAWFPLAGVWLCQEVWRAYEYQPNQELLQKIIVPLLEGSVRFCLDWLMPYGEYYVTNPSTSPEHRFENPKIKGDYRAVSMASTIDMSLIKEIFINYRKAVECVEKEQRTRTMEELLGEIDEVEPKLYPFCIGKDGRLQEWYKDFKEKEEGHRHLSHLYGLFPGELFCGNKQLTEAARKSLEYRMRNGSGNTGWSCAWAAELYAVLGDGEKAFSYLEKLLKESTYDNLWDAHPPLFFQIDGNFGGISAIADMLVQDRGGEVKILPALPEEWKDGYVKGLRIKGNKVIDIFWKNGELITYRVNNQVIK